MTIDASNSPCVDHGRLTSRYAVKSVKWSGEWKTMGLHRFVYEQHHGIDTTGWIVMHLCDNPRCVNVDHLRIGTQSENVKMAYDKQRKSLSGRAAEWAEADRCPRGHPYDVVAERRRMCSQCERARKTEWARKKRKELRHEH